MRTAKSCHVVHTNINPDLVESKFMRTLIALETSMGICIVSISLSLYSRYLRLNNLSIYSPILCRPAAPFYLYSTPIFTDQCQWKFDDMPPRRESVLVCVPNDTRSSLTNVVHARPEKKEKQDVSYSQQLIHCGMRADWGGGGGGGSSGEKQ